MALIYLVLVSIVLIIILVVMYYFSRLEISKLNEMIEQLRFDHRSLAVKHGQQWENFVPFMEDFNKIANRDNFTFIGMPIDGIAFDDDAIKFIEVKTGKSGLNEKQKQVKRLVQEKRVEWHEIRF